MSAPFLRGEAHVWRYGQVTDIAETAETLVVTRMTSKVHASWYIDKPLARAIGAAMGMQARQPQKRNVEADYATMAGLAVGFLIGVVFAAIVNGYFPKH